MLFAVRDFKGAIPRLHPKLLPENFAQIARNTRLEDGALGPVRQTTNVHTFGSNVLSIYLDGSTWRGWATEVDVATAPIADDRIYYTGSGAPKMMVAGVEYALALPAPLSAPTVANLATPNESLLETVYYAYTWVTGFGEESPPSPLSTALDTSADVTVRVNAFAATPAGRNITAKRIYRSQTTASGVTELFFVAEIAAATASYDHTLATAPLQEVIPSTDYDPPPAGLLGLTAMPNGMMAAFDGKEVYFSEPYQPHAWPIKYTLTVDHAIIGLAAFGSSLAILTSANPYIAQGTHPESMAMEKMDKSLPCLSRRGIVDVGYGALYPSGEGLAMISGQNAEIMSRNLFTREQWRALSPETFIAGHFDGRYAFTFTYSNFDIYDCGDASGFGAFVFDGGAAPASSLLGAAIFDFGSAISAFGYQRLGFIDISGQAPFFIDTDIVVPSAMHVDVSSGEFYMLENGTDVIRWEDPAAAFATQRWRSKTIVFPTPVNFGAFMVQTQGVVQGGNVFSAMVFADGAVVETITSTNTPERLPGGFRATQWEVEIVSDTTVTGFALASSVHELLQL